MTEIRCKKCNRLLMKKVEVVVAEVQCPKCGYKNGIIVLAEFKYDDKIVRSVQLIQV